MQNRANKDLFDLISALAGNSDFTTQEISHLLSLANRRFSQAYNTTPYWVRYLTVGEERTIANSIVPFTQTSKTDIGEFLKINREEPFLRNSTIDFEFFVESDGAHVINLTASDATSVFVTYRKPLTLLTTLDNNGNSGSGVAFSAFHADTDYVVIDVQDNNVIVTFDGSAPGASNGHLLVKEQGLIVLSKNAAKGAKFLGSGGASVIQSTEFVD
jgi:hypothetical protein